MKPNANLHPDLSQLITQTLPRTCHNLTELRQGTPLAKVFLVADQWAALKQSAQAMYFAEALRSRDVSFWEAFTAIDYDNNGLLTPAEFYGALVWLSFPDLTAEDVADFFESVDTNRDGNPDLTQLNPDLSRFNPNLSQLNPNFDPRNA